MDSLNRDKGESVDNILVTRSSMPPFEEYAEEISSLWGSHWLTNRGAKHRELESALKRYLDAEAISLFTNGHSALECVLEAMELEGEVITTPFTFVSTTNAIVRKGLTPVFADVRESDYTLDPAEVEKLITPRTCAIIPVHVYGNICDVSAFEEIAQKHNLKLIYDAAHAFGIRVDGRSAVTFGDASMLSFHATKVFNTIEGGAIVCHDETLAHSLEEWKNFGIESPESVVHIGGNAKMNEFCAAMGLCNLRHVDDEIAKRKVVAEKYFELLDGVPGVKLSIPTDNVRSNYAYLPVVFDEAFGATRDEVYEALLQDGIHARKYFYPLISDCACYCGRYDSAETPIAKHLSESVLTLPMYADLALEDVERICDVVVGTRR